MLACSHPPQVFGVLHEACRPGVLAKVSRKDIHDEVHEIICHVHPLFLSSGEPWEAPRAVLKADGASDHHYLPTWRAKRFRMEGLPR